MVEKEKELIELEKEVGRPNFWNDQKNASEVSQKISELKEEIEKIRNLDRDLQDLKEFYNISKDDAGLEQEMEKKYAELLKKVEREEFKLFLSGPHDKNNAILEIFAGAGGQDSQDWVAMLLRMYERYCATKGFKTQVLHQSFGEGGGPEGRIGIKSASVEIKGNYAYGFLKKESGVHRLVRISPFSAQKLRHTSFALVDVLPELIEKEKTDIEIKPEELRVDTFRAGGPGGQYVNKTESAVRITHIPTGIVVSSQTERLQGKNKENAMKILYAKLSQLKELQKEKELKDIKGELVSASWGNQIRSYVLHPYKMVKDLRTQYETSDTEGVLDGDIEKFIEAELKIK